MAKEIGWREFGFTRTSYVPNTQKATLSGADLLNPSFSQKGDVDVIAW
jgi:hypothetical protein